MHLALFILTSDWKPCNPEISIIFSSMALEHGKYQQKIWTVAGVVGFIVQIFNHPAGF